MTAANPCASTNPDMQGFAVRLASESEENVQRTDTYLRFDFVCRTVFLSHVGMGESIAPVT